MSLAMTRTSWKEMKKKIDEKRSTYRWINLIYERARVSEREREREKYFFLYTSFSLSLSLSLSLCVSLSLSLSLSLTQKWRIRKRTINRFM